MGVYRAKLKVGWPAAAPGQGAAAGTKQSLVRGPAASGDRA